MALKSKMDNTRRAGIQDGTDTSALRSSMEAKRLLVAPTGSKLTGEHGLNWERPKFGGGLRYPGGYCGHIMAETDKPHALDVPMKRSACLGYGGFRPGKTEIIGKPIVSLAEERGDGEAVHVHQAMAARGLHDPISWDGKESGHQSKASQQSEVLNIREMWKNVDIEERYAHAKKAVEDAGQDEDMLVQIVQAKLASRVNSYAVQHRMVKLIFESFDMNGDGVLDEDEFRECLERLNIQCNDNQVLTLFAYFDHERTGLIDWHSFQSVAMVHNPKGGTAVLPKMITQRCAHSK